jgi:hypothetical protein
MYIANDITIVTAFIKRINKSKKTSIGLISTIHRVSKSHTCNSKKKSNVLIRYSIRIKKFANRS